jgi:hypothetical protein
VAYLRFYPAFPLNGLTISRQPSVSTASLRAEIKSQESLDHYTMTFGCNAVSVTYVI